MKPQTLRLLFLNFGHFADHLFMLIFAKAAFSAGIEFGLGADGAYAEMIPYGLPSLVFFGAFAPIAAHLADKWSRNSMIVVFFIGVGLASILTSFADNPIEIAVGLAVLGIFAAIYHPVGITMVIEGGGRVGWRLGVNGVWGNMGVAAAPLLTGLILVHYDWRLAFVIPGVISVLIGVIFSIFVGKRVAKAPETTERERVHLGFAAGWQRALFSVSLVTAAGGFVFGSMTFIIPRMFEVKMPGISIDIAATGLLAGIVYAVAAFAQLIVGRAIDKYRIKPILLFVAFGQPIFLGLMSLQVDYALFTVSLIAMAFVFGQIPISDAVLSRYVPDQWRTKILSLKFLLNLVVGAIALLAARTILASGNGFEVVIIMLAVAACFIVLAALVLPARSGIELEDPRYLEPVK